MVNTPIKIERIKDLLTSLAEYKQIVVLSAFQRFVI